MDTWVIWLVIACVLGFAEMHQGGFYLAPFAIGALVAMVVTLAGAGALPAGIVFVGGSVVVLGTLRPLAQRHSRVPPALRTGTAALVGHEGVVTEGIDNLRGLGRVKIGGEVWTARSYQEDLKIEPGERVEVVEIRGATALVMQWSSPL